MTNFSPFGRSPAGGQKIILSLVALAIIAAVGAKGYEYFSYRMALGKARPDLFYQLTLNDPLFYSEKIDAEKLEKSVNKIKKIELEVKEALIKKYLYAGKNAGPAFEIYSEFLKDPGRTFLHPLDFLGGLPPVYKYTADFLKNKDAKNAAKLLKSYEQAIGAYKKSADEQRQIWQKVIAAVPRPASYQGLAGATNANIVIRNYEVIEKNATVLEKELAERKRCFWEGQCPASKPEEANSPAAVSAKLALVPDYLLETIGLSSPKLGPYSVRTACFGNEENNLKPEHDFYILLQKPPGTDEPLFMPKLASENYYYFYPDVPAGDFAKKITELGYRYYFQTEAASYLCNDLEYWADLSLAASGDKLAYLPEMINTMARDLSALKSSVAVEDLIRPDALLVFYSNYSIAYLPFTERSWRVEERPTYIEKIARVPVSYAAYSELKKTMPDEEIKKFHFRASDIRTELIKQKEGEFGFFEWIYSKIIYSLSPKVINILPVESLPQPVIK